MAYYSSFSRVSYDNTYDLFLRWIANVTRELAIVLMIVFVRYIFSYDIIFILYNNKIMVENVSKSIIYGNNLKTDN